MKKLMMVLAAVLAVGMVNAASLDWAIAQKAFLMSDDSQPKGVTVYVLNAGADKFATLSTILSTGTGGAADYANLAAVMSGTEFTSVKLGTGTTYSSSNATLMGKNYAKASGTVDVGSVGTFNVAILVTDGEKYLLSGTTSGISYSDSPDDGSAANFGDAKFTSGWNTYTMTGGGEPVVPEPTSGLLLLVGGAMLALRRKQK